MTHYDLLFNHLRVTLFGFSCYPRVCIIVCSRESAVVYELGLPRETHEYSSNYKDTIRIPYFWLLSL